MGYRIIDITQTNIGTPDIALGVSVSGVTSILLTRDQAFENFKNLLLTRIGERFAQPNFGTNLLNILFQPNTNFLQLSIEDIITQPVNFWLPYINIEQIEVVTPESDPTLDYVVQVKITFSFGDLDTQTIIISVTETAQLEIGQSNGN